jgi:anti-sigma regulatory factor (Ser/Thr protein kinase)
LGIFLMRKLMDDVHYEVKSNKSNVLTMTKRKR